MSAEDAQVPVVLVSGIDPEAAAATVLGLQLDLPGSVVVRHALDVAQQHLTRVVSDASGVLERHVTPLDHACVSCALREDVLPTLERLARAGLYDAVIAQLPPAADALQVCRVLNADARVAPSVRVSAVVAALDGAGLALDLTGDDLLSERGLQTSAEDARGVAEVLCGLVEYADRVVVTRAEDADDEAIALVRTLARPDAVVHTDPFSLDSTALVAGVHEHRRTEAWIDPVPRTLVPIPATGAWVCELGSDRPFHPGRLLERIEELGCGPWRARGCFWLPTRPDAVGCWDGAGGQLSIGAQGQWGRGPQVTRLLFMGLDEDSSHDQREQIERAFAACLLTDEEMRVRGPYWEAASDGLEPWMGPITRAD